MLLLPLDVFKIIDLSYVGFLYGISAVVSIFAVPFSFGILATVSDNANEKKCNFPSVPIAKKDLLFQISNANEPDRIVIKDDSKKYDIDIRFAIDQNLIYGFKFYDKGIYIDNKEYLENDAIDFLKNNLKGHIYIIWYTESNDPKQFKIVLNELKNKEKTDEEQNK